MDAVAGRSCWENRRVCKTSHDPHSSSEKTHRRSLVGTTETGRGSYLMCDTVGFFSVIMRRMQMSLLSPQRGVKVWGRDRHDGLHLLEEPF